MRKTLHISERIQQFEAILVFISTTIISEPWSWIEVTFDLLINYRLSKINDNRTFGINNFQHYESI